MIIINISCLKTLFAKEMININFKQLVKDWYIGKSNCLHFVLQYEKELI